MTFQLTEAYKEILNEQIDIKIGDWVFRNVIGDVNKKNSLLGLQRMLQAAFDARKDDVKVIIDRNSSKSIPVKLNKQQKEVVDEILKHQRAWVE